MRKIYTETTTIAFFICLFQLTMSHNLSCTNTIQLGFIFCIWALQFDSFNFDFGFCIPLWSLYTLNFFTKVCVSFLLSFRLGTLPQRYLSKEEIYIFPEYFISVHYLSSKSLIEHLATSFFHSDVNFFWVFQFFLLQLKFVISEVFIFPFLLIWDFESVFFLSLLQLLMIKLLGLIIVYSYDFFSQIIYNTSV